MPGVPSGCFTGSFWYGGIQCTVFHFLQTFLLSGHTLPYQTFHYSFPGGCEPSDYMDMLPLPSAVKEAPVLQEEYIPLSSC